MAYFSDHNNYLKTNDNSSYSSMLYNDDQDDDEMADEPRSIRQLPTTI